MTDTSDPAAGNPPTAPTDQEIRAAGSTVFRGAIDDRALRERLAQATALLAGLGADPVEPSLVFASATAEGSTAASLAAGMTVGRESDCDLVFPDCDEMSRHHFRVQQRDGHWLLEDLQSSNGTYLFGDATPIQRRILRDGDIILAGDLALLFVNPDA